MSVVRFFSLCWVLVAAVLLSGAGQKAADQLQTQGAELQDRCGVRWLPAATFADRSASPSHSFVALTSEIIRAARWCRYGGLKVIVYPDDDSEASVKLARDRASTLKQMIAGPSWPDEKIETTVGSAGDAPEGEQFDKTFRVQATVEYIDPDPNWRKPPGYGIGKTCTVVNEKAVCVPLPKTPSEWARDPWPEIGPEMPMIFFDSGSAMLSPEARAVTAEAARRFLEVNCRLLPLTALTDTAEADPVGLSIRRALITRTELIKDGVDSSAIVIHALGSTELLVPTPPNTPEPQNRRLVFDCED